MAKFSETAIKKAIIQLCNPGRDRSILQGTALRKNIGACSICNIPGRKCDLLQCRACFKDLRSHIDQRFRKLDFLQRTAFQKCIIVDLCYVLWNIHLCKPCTAAEGIGLNFFHCIRDLYGFKAFTVLKNAVGNIIDSLCECNLFKIGTIYKRSCFPVSSINTCRHIDLVKACTASKGTSSKKFQSFRKYDPVNIFTAIERRTIDDFQGCRKFTSAQLQIRTVPECICIDRFQVFGQCVSLRYPQLQNAR